jgi:type IV secretory pathway TrbF-like protein
VSFADPQSITVNAVAQSMPRTGSGINSGTFTQDDGTNALSIAHQYGKRTRRAMKFTDSKVAANPFDTTRNEKVSMSVSLVVDVPPQGYTIAEQKYIVDGLVAYLTASSGAKVTQLLGGES